MKLSNKLNYREAYKTKPESWIEKKEWGNKVRDGGIKVEVKLKP